MWLRQNTSSKAKYMKTMAMSVQVPLKAIWRPDDFLPCDVQSHSILCQASWCWHEAYEQQSQDWDLASRWRGDGTKDVPLEYVLTWCWGQSDAPHIHGWPCSAQTGYRHLPVWPKQLGKVLLLSNRNKTTRILFMTDILPILLNIYWLYIHS